MIEYEPNPDIEEEEDMKEEAIRCDIENDDNDTKKET